MNGFFASRRRSVALLAETVALGMLAGVLLFSPLSSYAQDAASQPMSEVPAAADAADHSDRDSVNSTDAATEQGESPALPSGDGETDGQDESAVPADPPAEADDGSNELEPTASADNNAADTPDSTSESTPQLGGDIQQEEAAPLSAADNSVEAQSNSAAKPSLGIEAHVQNLGWQKAVSLGKTAGTVGRNLHLEALRISLVGFPDGSGISLQAHVSNLGWINSVQAGQVAGTVGRNLPIEALRLSLTGPIADQYDIWYRVHSADFGWGGWAKNGESAGSQGYAKAAQAVQIQLLPKGSSAPGSVKNAFRVFYIGYQAHVSNIGWQGRVTDGSTAGTTGKNLGIEALNISLGGAVSSGGVQVRAHVSNIGWQGWTSGTAGTTGRGLSIEALQIRLTDSAAESYDIWYRVHVTNLGWLGWTSNASPAGTTGKAYSIQAVQIQLVQKGKGAPGSTTNSYVGAEESLTLSGITLSGAKTSSSRASSVAIGSTGSSNPLQSFSVSVNNKIAEGSLSYRALLTYSGWQGSWTGEGTQVNTGNNGLAMSAVALKLSGDLASKYDIWYRVSVVGRGWLGWTSNGASAGVNGFSDGINAIQVALTKKGSSAPGSIAGPFVEPSAGSTRVVYQAHSSNVGWVAAVTDGATAGTTGRGLALEALRVSVQNAKASGTVQVTAHVADAGWQSAAAAPSFAGTTGKNRAIQAVKLQLTGDLSNSYDIYYRVHSSGYGWLGWAKNGEVAGTTGLAVQAEAVQIKLVPKGTAGPTSSVPASVSIPTLALQTHVQDLGWTSTVGNGGVSGTTGRALKIEGVKLSVSSQISGGISYRAYVQDVGWQKEVSNGALAGTTGQNKRIEAVQIRLTGQLANYFDIWYRAHVEGYGWLGWTKNGSTAGTAKIGYRAEALQVKIVAKGAPAPGSTTMSYTEKPLVPADQLAMTNRIQGISSATGYLLAVDTATCRTGVFVGGRGHWSLLYYWPCGPGKPSTPTVKGQYTVQAKGYVFGHGYSCYYYTQFYGDYLFHSIKYNPGTFNVQDGRLGVQVSEGCVRLALENAKWIYDHIPRGTKVVIW